jgi:hypothetical protein
VAACVGGTPQTCSPGTPSAETCNNKDDDCDGTNDDNLGATTCGIGECRRTVQNCVAGVTQTCTPGTPTAESCNGKDDDCDGSTDENFDADADGWAACNGDCNDSNGTVYPGAFEACNGIDDDCDGQIDEGHDFDGDTYTWCGTVPGGGLSPARVDCEDGIAAINPGATEICDNAVDENCDGYVCTSCDPVDRDGDGYSQCNGDCAPNDPAVHPGAAEVCDGKDTDCNQNTIDNCAVGQTCNWPTSDDICKDDLICAQNLSNGQFICGSFCNYSPLGQGLGDGCASAEVCQFMLVASGNDHLCGIPTAAPGTSLAGANCTSDSNCRSRDCYCPDPAGANCKVQPYCSDFCGDDRTYCTANTACTVVESGGQGSDPITLTTLCRKPAASGVTGAACTAQNAATTCRYGARSCINNRCAEPCCNDSKCPNGYHCSPFHAQFEVYGTFSDTSNPAISAVPSCLPNSGTNLGRRAGAACSVNSDCLSEFCDTANLGGKCVEFCCNDASCPNGTLCELVRVRKSNNQEMWGRVCVHSPVPDLVTQN